MEKEKVITWEKYNNVCSDVTTAQCDIQAVITIMGMMINEYGLDSIKLDTMGMEYLAIHWDEISNMFSHMRGVLIDSVELLEKTTAAL